MHERVSVCIFAGHTGGHLFPALAFAQRFKKRFPHSELILITSPKARPLIEPLAAGTLNRVEYLNEFPFFSGISLRGLLFLLEFCRAFFLSFQKLTRLKPRLCVGFGSYVSYPGMKLACWKRVPTMIHEQNKIAGKATRHLASSAEITAVSFPGTELGASPRRLEVAGLPIRSGLYDASQGFVRRFEENSEANPFRIFITGGSQGAHKLNKVILESFFRFSPEETKKIVVTHITGTQDFEWVKEEYKKMKLNATVYPFFANMQDLYRHSDFALTRAGANTLYELALFGLPALAVPFPHAAENHQEINARFFESKGALLVEKEGSLTPDLLASKLRGMMAPNVRRVMSENLRRLAPEDAAEKLTDLASELVARDLSWK